MNELKNHYELITFPKIADTRGNLSFIEENKHVPFDIKRVYYTYDIPADSSRGGHAHIELHEVLIAISGSFQVILKDGYEEKEVFLNKPNVGLHIYPGIWREIVNFSAGSAILVLASDIFKEPDYIREYDSFLKFKRCLK